MAESGTTGAPSREKTAVPSREGWRRVLRWWGKAGAFLAGLLVGAVLVGLLSEGSVVVAAPEPADVDVLPPGAADEGGITGQATLDADCLRAVNAAQDVAQLLDDLGEALAVLNAARLDEVVRRLQPLERRLQSSVEACEVRAGSAGGSPPPELPPAPAVPTSPPAAD